MYITEIYLLLLLLFSFDETKKTLRCERLNWNTIILTISHMGNHGSKRRDIITSTYRNYSVGVYRVCPKYWWNYIFIIVTDIERKNYVILWNLFRSEIKIVIKCFRLKLCVPQHPLDDNGIIGAVYNMSVKLRDHCFFVRRTYKQLLRYNVILLYCCLSDKS